MADLEAVSGGRLTLSCVMTSADMVSRVTRAASFLEVPASRSECATTRAPILGRTAPSAAVHVVKVTLEL